MRFPSLDEITSRSASAIRRFPGAIVAAAVFTTLVWIKIGEEYHWTGTERLPLSATIDVGWIFAAVLGIPLAIAAVLVAERMGRRAIEFGLYGLIAVLLVAYGLITGNAPEDNVVEIYRFALFLVVAHLLVAFAAHLGSRREGEFWEFNKTLFLRTLTGALFSGVLYAGLAGALLAIDHLLLGGEAFEEQTYGRLFVVVAAIFNTIFVLVGVPAIRPDDTPAPDTPIRYPKGLKVFAQYLLLPIAVLYLAILYAFMAKIILQWEWPEGWVAWLVITFSAVGVLALLLLYPLRREEGNRWIAVFTRWFYAAILPLIGLLSASIATRISDYGITENRYYVVALAVWLFGTALYFLLSKRKDIRVIPASLAVLAFVSAFGPWGAFGLSTADQAGRFRSIANDAGAVKDGKIVIDDPAAIDSTAAVQLESILRYLDERDELDRIADLVPGGIAEEEDHYQLAQRLKLPEASMGAGVADHVWIDAASGPTASALDLSGYDVMIGPRRYPNPTVPEEIDTVGALAGTALHNGHTYAIYQHETPWSIVATEDGDTVGLFSLDSFLENLRRSARTDTLQEHPERMTIGSLPPYRALLVIHDIQGGSSDAALMQMEYSVLIDRTDE